MLTELTDGKVHNLKTLKKEYGYDIDIDVDPWNCGVGGAQEFTVHETQFCCGMREVGSFDASDTPIFRHAMKKWMQAADKGILHVATDVHGSDVCQSLEYLGWEEVTSFVNTNSGNTVNVYHFYKPL